MRPAKKHWRRLQGNLGPMILFFKVLDLAYQRFVIASRGGGLREKGARWYGALTTIGFLNRQIAADISKEHLPGKVSERTVRFHLRELWICFYFPGFQIPVCFCPGPGKTLASKFVPGFPYRYWDAISSLLSDGIRA